MEPYQQRVVDEKTELDEKIAKLSPFTDSETFKGMPLMQQSLLTRQLAVMTEYSEILGSRIEAF